MTHSCKLIGNLFSYMIQFFLGIAVICTLLIKRFFENPKRDIVIWSLDISKILIGGFIVHLQNIVITRFILTNNTDDECSWYFINFLADCSLGVLFVYLIHDGIFFLLKKINFEKDYLEVGKYGTPINYKIWGVQTGIYLLTLTLNKIIIVPLLYLLNMPLSKFGNWIFKPVSSRPNIELILVMIICPWILSSFQFIMFDCMLKYKDYSTKEYLLQLCKIKRYYKIDSETDYNDLSTI